MHSAGAGPKAGRLKVLSALATLVLGLVVALVLGIAIAVGYVFVGLILVILLLAFVVARIGISNDVCRELALYCPYFERSTARS